MTVRLTIVLALVLLSPALAHEGHHTLVDDTSPEMKFWIEGLKNKNGVGCCSTADGFPADVEWDTEGNHYRVRIEGKWYVVPDVALLTQPNKLGHAMVWYFYQDGEPVIRCFIPGTTV